LIVPAIADIGVIARSKAQSGPPVTGVPIKLPDARQDPYGRNLIVPMVSDITLIARDFPALALKIGIAIDDDVTGLSEGLRGRETK
jgi:hypothetical protein